MSRTTVVIVDDHALIRTGLRTELNARGFDVVAEASDGPEGLRAALEHRPAVMIVDIALPGFDGLELTRRVKAELAHARVVVVTMRETQADVTAALAAGADGYCVKHSDTSNVVAAVEAAARGAVYLDPLIASAALSSVKASPLTPREVEILRLVADGTNNLDIADRLNLSMGTVKGHIRDILDKLDAADRTQAAVIALKRQLI